MQSTTPAGSRKFVASQVSEFALSHLIYPSNPGEVHAHNLHATPLDTRRISERTDRLGLALDHSTGIRVRQQAGMLPVATSSSTYQHVVG
jgi:hypothetical protein